MCFGDVREAMHSGVTNGRAESESPPDKLNVKIVPRIGLHFGFRILLAFSRLLFFECFGIFSGR